MGDFFLAAGVSEIDTAVFDVFEDGADRVRPSERDRHLRSDLLTQPLEERRVFSRKDDFHGRILVRLCTGALGGEDFHDTDPLKE
jgi:hypothetical protein